MYGQGVPTPSGFNGTRDYSPLTMSRDWPTLGRLLFIVACACVGSFINGFFIAAFFVEHALKRIGNVYHACVGMADMIVTAAVMPVAAVVLLSGQWDTPLMCQFLQFVTEAATYCYSMFFTLVAAENYYRLCSTSKKYDAFISMPIGLVSILVFVIGFFIAGVGTFLGLDYDYCSRRHYGNFFFRFAASIIFYVIPFFMAFYTLVAAAIQVRYRARGQTYYRRSQQYERDLSMTSLNLAAYTLFVAAWIPYIVVIHKFPNSNDSLYYHCAWLGISRTMITSCMYNSMNRNFRRAFAHLFYYCCCKSTMTGSFNSRHRRAIEFRCLTGDVRVHIMHQAVNVNSHQGASSSYRETQNL